jgi:predicted HD phosphohydrolase
MEPMTDRPTFTRMGEGTQADYEAMRAHAQREIRDEFPLRILRLLGEIDGISIGSEISRLDHSLQAATRAYRDGADTETVMCALLHDVAVPFAPFGHDVVAAGILKPFVSERNHWVVAHHGIFQGYYYFHHFGLDRNARDKYLGSPFYDDCVHFCAEWDEVSSDPAYPTEPIEFFTPMVLEFFGRPPRNYDGV